MSLWNTEHARNQRSPGAPRPRNSDTPVADKGRAATLSGEVRIGFAAAQGTNEITFRARRTEQDRHPPKRVVTAQLMGDPKPGRSAQDQLLAEARSKPVADFHLPTWTREDIADARKLKAAGRTQREIAEIFKRPLGSVASMLTAVRRYDAEAAAR